MELRKESSASCETAFPEAQRWVEAVTKKKFGSSDFRCALENGVLLCDLINKIKPGIIKRVNRLSTPIAGLDNLNVFLKACSKLGLKEAQLFHPGDLQDLSSRVTVKHQETCRRLKNVLITIYWLGRKAESDPFYNGPYLNLRAFEGLLDTPTSKALEDRTFSRGSIGVSDSGDSWYSDREELFTLRAGHRRDDSPDSLDSLGSRTHSTSSDTTLKGSSEGCGSDPEAELGFKMTDNKDSLSYRRSLVVTPKTNTQFNQFLPSKDKASGYVPAPLRKKRAERNEDNRRSLSSFTYTDEDDTISSVDRPDSGLSPADRVNSQSSQPAAHLTWAYEYESGSDSDNDHPDPDLVLDDLASRRFHSPTPVTPTNFSVPMSLREASAIPRGTWPQVAITKVQRQTLTHFSNVPWPPQRKPPQRRAVSAEAFICDDSEEDDDEFGDADPVQDDLYTRKVGLIPQPSSSVPYDKFLPKFWTPEEDAHVQRIKLGSQRRPWYRKIQGFSHKKSGSSSDDSDCDISPWVSASSPSLSQSDTSQSHPHASKGTTQPCLPTTSSPHMQPHTVAQNRDKPLWLECPPEGRLPSPDPTAGPRLVRCEKRPLLGREHPNDPYNVPADILPDLENDDMYARRTNAFHPSTDLAQLKYGGFLTPRYRSEPAINIVRQSRHNESGNPVYPDIEKDDVVYRKVNPKEAQRPLSGAPDTYHPVPIPQPWALPCKLQAKLLCPPCPPTKEAEPEKKHYGKAEDHAKTDDMLLRKLSATHICGAGSIAGSSQRPAAAEMAPSVPSSCSEEDLLKWQAIREASRLRHKKRLMVERLQQKESDSDGSKSMSDISVDPAVSKEVRYEELQKLRSQLKESEDKWQDDLTKWKNRRKSVNSDIMKKKEEREHIEVLTSGSSARKSKTFKEMQEERESRDKGSFKSRYSAFSTSEDHEDVFSEPASRTRGLPARSYTIDSPYTPNDRSTVSPVPPVKKEEPKSGSLSEDQEDFPVKAGRSSPHSPVNTSVTTSKSLDSQTSDTTVISSRTQGGSSFKTSVTSRSSLDEPTSTSKPMENSASYSSTVSESKRPSGWLIDDQSQGSFHKHNSVEAMQPSTARVSASLPRTFQRTESGRLPTVVMPKPFGTQSTRVSSLPRAFMMEDKRLNGDPESSRKTTIPSRYAQFVTEDEARSYSGSAQSSNEDEDDEEDATEVSNIQNPYLVPRASSVSPQPKPASPLGHVSDTKQEDYSDMRISLNQKPNSSRDFGFQTDWDSTGVRVKSIQQGSPAEMYQMRVGDEVLSVNGHRVADMSYAQWKNSMKEALEQGSLIMDVRRHGVNNWGRDLPSLPFKSHKTINLTSMDPLGSPEPFFNTNLDFTSNTGLSTTMKTVDTSSKPVNNLGSNGMNGGYHHEPVTMRNKASESISLRNLKRRSEFFEQGSAGSITINSLVYLCGGSETPLLDVPVPSLSSSSNRWSWDVEQERIRQEKWQKEQERLLQEKYKRDQEKLEEEFKRDQQAAAQENFKYRSEEKKTLELDSRSISPHSPLSPLSEPTPPWEDHEQEMARLAQQQEEEMRRKEEEKQRLEEERRKREEEEHKRQEEERRRREEERLRLEEERRMREELERLEEERRQREEEEERKRQEEMRRRREEEAERLQRKKEEEERRQQEEWEREQQQRSYNHMDSYEYVSMNPDLSYSHRVMSKSTPELDEAEKADHKGAHSRHRGMADWLLEEELKRKRNREILRQQAASELEAERRNILHAMKYRDPERVVTGGLKDASQKKNQPLSQAELERQQIIQEMKKKTSLHKDSSWIRQPSPSSVTSKKPVSLIEPLRRGESLDNLDSTRHSSWRSSWTPGSTSSIPDYSRPHSALSSSTSYRGSRPGSATLPASQSMSSLRQYPSSPTTPNPQYPLSKEAGLSDPHQSSQRNRSVSGRKICTYCDSPLGKGAAMIIESLGLCYHLHCFKCVECRSDLGGSEAGAEVRIRNRQLYCNSCYIRCKAGQPTSM
ncbi:LIM domain only protein 7 [Chanos chanos]|uniref:LIM domain only protein 7 n=1 Tax=Chanos chanos TaxID=29144 RepID=A0A6J2WFX7_CHACN|nr:LIM domain only protein 7-like [Chanos chanos]